MWSPTATATDLVHCVHLRVGRGDFKKVGKQKQQSQQMVSSPHCLPHGRQGQALWAEICHVQQRKVHGQTSLILVSCRQLLIRFKTHSCHPSCDIILHRLTCPVTSQHSMLQASQFTLDRKQPREGEYSTIHSSARIKRRHQPFSNFEHQRQYLK